MQNKPEGDLGRHSDAQLDEIEVKLDAVRENIEENIS